MSDTFLFPDLPPSRGDAEVIPTSLPSPVATGSGVEANHSSEVLSLDPAQNVQWNDDEIIPLSAGHLDPGGYDPNMSGPHATEPVEDARSGYMNGGSTVDALDCADDYRMWATEEAGGSQEYGPDSVSPQGDFGSSNGSIAGIVVFPIVRRA